MAAVPCSLGFKVVQIFVFAALEELEALCTLDWACVYRWPCCVPSYSLRGHCVSVDAVGYTAS